MELIASIPSQCTLGEGVIYDDRSDSLLWVDIVEKRLFIYELSTSALESVELPFRLGSFGLTETWGVIIAAFEQGFAFYNWQTADLYWIQQLEQDLAYTRFNDGRVDHDGVFWAGTMVEPDKAPEGQYTRGKLYRLGLEGEAVVKLEGLSITNSLCWSPDGEVLYHTDTPSQCIYAYENSAGLLKSKGLLVRTETSCYPDGSCVDSKGYLWNAQWGGSQVVQYSPQGKENTVLTLPVSQPSCVCFAGEQLDLLAVTSARESLTAEQLVAEPEAGNLLIYRTYYKGLAENRCKMPHPF